MGGGGGGNMGYGQGMNQAQGKIWLSCCFTCYWFKICAVYFVNRWKLDGRWQSNDGWDILTRIQDNL